MQATAEDQLFGAASDLHRQGKLPQAERMYRQILCDRPAHAPAMAQLGLLLAQQGDAAGAVQWISRAVALDDQVADWHNNLGVCQRIVGSLDEAIGSCQRAVELRCDYADAYSNLGLSLAEKGQFTAAGTAYKRALELQPNSAAAHTNLGLLLQGRGELEGAIESLRRATELHAASADAHNNLANALRQAGKLTESLAAFETALHLAPRSPVILNNFGNALRDNGQLNAALDCYTRAITIDPRYADAHGNLGNILKDQGDWKNAVAAYRKAIELQPRAYVTRSNLALALADQGNLAQAIAELTVCLQTHPDFAEGYNNLGVCLRKNGSTQQAIVAFQRAIQLSPHYCEAHSNFASTLVEQGNMQEGLAAHEHALRINPNSPEALNNYAVALRTAGRFVQAVKILRKAIQVKRTFTRAHSNLGAVLREQGELDEAITVCRQAIEIDPKTVEAHNNLANCYRDQGLLDHAIESFSRALALAPQASDIESNRVYTMQFHADSSEDDLATAACRWAQNHAVSLKPRNSTHAGPFSSAKRLRIGYVSPDFRRHAAACFMMPLLGQHDAAQVETFCYAGVKRPDDITAQLQKLSHHWRSTIGFTDDAMANMIRRDQIDILVDLTLHMGDNRLLVFARRPAPVQVTWLGYPGTTGLSTIDYRLSDPHLDPDPAQDAVYAEKTIRLPHSFWCYAPIATTPDVNELPALRNNRITFGSFNNFCKVTPQTVKLWSQTLRAIRSAGILIQSQPGSHRQRVLREMSEQGVSPDRVAFIGLMRDDAYFKLYHRVDACLDPIPYPGHTTSLDSLWMGVPVITMTGRTAASRGGASILRNAGLHEFVADSPEQYITIAHRLADDLAALQNLRRTLRQNLQASPLMNAKQFAADMECIFRRMWQNYYQTTQAKAA